MDVLDTHWLIESETLRWRPLSLPRPRTGWLDRRGSVAVIAGLVLLHGLALWWQLSSYRGRDHAGSAAPALWIEFITRAPEPPPSEQILIRPPSSPASSTPRASPRIRPVSAPPSEPATNLAQEAPRAREDPLRMYAPDGSLLLPDDLLAQIDRKFGDQRDFSFQRPGLDAMDKLLHRPQAIEYEATRFEAGWRPETDQLTGLLEKALEKTSPTIRIPVPGRPGARLVCRVVLLAAGGSCWFESNSDGYQVVLNDPATLDEEEQRQCQAWWDKITGAGTQDVWRRTRALYDAECRKPPERKRPEPGPSPAG